MLAGYGELAPRGGGSGGPTIHTVDVLKARVMLAGGLSVRATVRQLGVPHVAVSRVLAGTAGWNKSPVEVDP